MADQLYLSCWLANFSPLALASNFEKLLAAFPFSKLARTDPVLRIYAVAFSEPPLMETAIPSPADPSAIARLASEFQNPDCCYEITAAWDLWVPGPDWKLGPATVSLACFGPAFESEGGEHLRIDFGLETQFLPGVEVPGGMPMIRSNIQSLLRLVHDLDDRFALERRLLWSESGENFADRLQAALARM